MNLQQNIKHTLHYVSTQINNHQSDKVDTTSHTVTREHRRDTRDQQMDTKEQNEETETRDKMSKAIGELGTWQIFIFIMASVPSKVSATWSQLSIIYLAPKTTFRCVNRQNSTEVFNSTCYSDCVKYEYYSNFNNTIISEWNLICDRAWLANFTQTVFMFGVLIGSVTFGFIADRYGRRPGLLISSMIQLCCSIIIPFCPDYWTFTAIRLILGTSTAGLLVVSFVIIVEIIGPSKREFMTAAHHVPVAVGQTIMPAFSYYLRSWDKYSLGLAIPYLIFLSYIFIIPESPKWLISTGRLEEASRIMTTAAKYNKLPKVNMAQVAEDIAKEIYVNRDKSREDKASYLDLIRIKFLRMKNLCSCICWFILGLSFYGGAQYIGQTSSNTFISVSLAGALQIPGLLLSGFLYKQFGRRRTTVGFCIVCSISNGLLILPDDWYYIKLVSGAVAVSCAAGAFSTIYTFTSELFPTVVRNMAVGASSTASRAGSMLAPFVAGLNGASWVPPAIFTAVPLIAAAVCCRLPETKGKKLLNHLSECK